MSTVFVKLRLPDRSEVVVSPGGIIGRLHSAAATIEDPRVSEAHALVSLRSRSLKLLALRGAMEQIGRQAHQLERVTELDLEAGQRIRLAEDVVIEVVEVALPGQVLALAGAGDKPVELSVPVTSILTKPTLRVEAGYVPGYAARAWLSGERWVIQIGAGRPEPLRPGARYVIDGHQLWAISVSLGQVGVDSTRQRGQLHPGMTLTVFYDHTQVTVEGRPPVSLSGNGARLLAELVLFEEPTPWELVAGEVWPEKRGERALLRDSWDKALRQLRAQLDAAGLRADLIQTRRGVASVSLLAGDNVISRV